MQLASLGNILQNNSNLNILSALGSNSLDNFNKNPILSLIGSSSLNENDLLKISSSNTNNISSSESIRVSNSLVWRNYKTGENALWLVNGTSVSFSATLPRIPNTNWEMVAVGDFNGDGQKDVFWRDYVTGDNAIWLLNGTTISSYAFLQCYSDTNWEIAAAADFNGDRKADIVWRNYQTGENRLWLMDGSTRLAEANLQSVADNNWEMVAAADCNGDSKADIVWRNYQTGENAIWLMNGSNITSSAFVLQVTDTNWAIASVDDFNGDGKADIVWRNYQTGENAIWLMNGTNISSTAFLPQMSDSFWEITGSEIFAPIAPASGLTGFNSSYGYGMVNAATAVATAIGQSGFTNLPNSGGNNWGNDMINAPEAWARGYTGQGITVAVIDDGVDINHEDLRGNIWVNTREIPDNGIDDDSNGYIDDINGWNFTTGVGGNNGNVRPDSSFSTHGTHVAGTIAAQNNGIGVTGVAYNANIMALKVANTAQGNDGSIYWRDTGNLSRAIRYAVNNGARVINLSLSWNQSPQLRKALSYAARHNVITVSAAGNSADSTSRAAPKYPANYATQYGISVGAVDRNQVIAWFSNLAGSDSRMHHVMAPGVNIFSTLLNNRYGYYSGTSMATNYVAGVVALMLSANSNLTSAQIRRIIVDSATHMTAV